METFELEINKSRFIAYKLELSSLDIVKPFLESLRKEHKRLDMCVTPMYIKKKQ